MSTQADRADRWLSRATAIEAQGAPTRAVRLYASTAAAARKEDREATKAARVNGRRAPEVQPSGAQVGCMSTDYLFVVAMIVATMVSVWFGAYRAITGPLSAEEVKATIGSFPYVAKTDVETLGKISVSTGIPIERVAMTLMADARSGLHVITTCMAADEVDRRHRVADINQAAKAYPDLGKHLIAAGQDPAVKGRLWRIIERNSGH